LERLNALDDSFPHALVDREPVDRLVEQPDRFWPESHEDLGVPDVWLMNIRGLSGTDRAVDVRRDLPGGSSRGRRRLGRQLDARVVQARQPVDLGLPSFGEIEARLM
jgi:hypothetical protein